MNILSLILAQTAASQPNVASEVVKKEEQFIAGFKGLSFEGVVEKIATSLIDFGFKLIVALLVFYVGRFIIRKLYRFVHNVMARRGTDASLSIFLLSVLKITLYFILVVIVIGILGIETTSILALFASAGVAIGMALSGTLQNFAGGVLILLLKPYRVGDFIEAQGYSGRVKEIQIFNTIINTLDNKAIIIPNGGLSTGTINNYSLEDYRRVEWTVGLSYDTDYDAVKKVILSMLLEDDRVVKQYIETDRLLHIEAAAAEDAAATTEEQRRADAETAQKEEVKKEKWWKHIFGHREKIELPLGTVNSPELGKPIDCSPFVGLAELADSSINIAVRAWTTSDSYWGVFYDMNERFYKELPEKGFSFPFPQLDVHVASGS